MRTFIDEAVGNSGFRLWSCSLEVFEIPIVSCHGVVVPAGVTENLPVIQVDARSEDSFGDFELRGDLLVLPSYR